MRIVVLGGGPGGYVAAIRAAQLGADVIIIEKNKIGGTCLNIGCIPTKVLLHAAEMIENSNYMEDIGIKFDNLTYDWDRIMSRKIEVVDQLVDGVKGLLISNNIVIINGLGEFNTDKSIIITSGEECGKIIEFDACIIAVGSESSIIPIKGIDLDGVVTSKEALSFRKIPDRMVITGGGVIGSEFAEIYSSFGSKVTIVEMADSILPMIDKEIVSIAREKLFSKNIKIMENARVSEIYKKDSLVVKVKINDETVEIKADKILVAAGRKANTNSIKFEKIGIKSNHGMISVDANMKTNLKNIYAVGDCNGGVMLAHVASAEGIVAAEDIMNKKTEIDFKTIPSAIYTKPEIASVGIDETEAVKKGLKVSVGRFPLMVNGKSLIMGEEGLVKIVAESETEEILGVQIIGPRATDIIAEAALAIRLEATVNELITTIHAHPTVSESVMEAAMDVFGNAIHLPK